MSNKIKDLKYIDCHSHPHDERYKTEGIDIDKILEDLKNDGGGTIAIGTDYDNCEKAIEVAKKHDNVWATIGVHPADNHSEIFDEKKFEKLLESGQTTPNPSSSEEGNFRKVVGVGECGLDYFYFDKIFGEGWKNNLEVKEKVEKEIERQKKLFINQINFAIKHSLPLVVHGRPSKNSMDAYRDILEILEQTTPIFSSKKSPLLPEGEFPKLRGHAHFFVGNLEIAKRFLNLGFLLSFDGPITFTDEYNEIIKYIPIEKIMIETDSPYASPIPYRGQINYPKYVIYVAEKIAKIKNLQVDEVLEISKNNTIKLFQLDL